MSWEKKAVSMYELTIREICSKYNVDPRFKSKKKKTKQNIVNEIIKHEKLNKLSKEKAIAIELISNLYNHPNIVLTFMKDNIRLALAKRNAIITLNALKEDLTMFDEIMRELLKISSFDILKYNITY